MYFEKKLVIVIVQIKRRWEWYGSSMKDPDLEWILCFSEYVIRSKFAYRGTDFLTKVQGIGVQYWENRMKYFKEWMVVYVKCNNLWYSATL